MSFISSLQALKKKYGYGSGTPTSTVTEAKPVAVTTTAVEVQEVLIDGYPIDATLSESHNFPAEVTSYPREKGSEATDHVRQKPIQLSLDCVVSDTPIGLIASHTTRTKDTSLPSGTIYQRLLALRESGEPVDVSTSLDVYENMVLSNLEIPRESGEPHQLHFRAEFTQATIVENQRTTVRVATPAGQGPLSLGERLAKLGDERIWVWTSQARDATYAEEYKNYVGLLVLTDRNGDRHYQIVPGEVTHTRDGYVDKNGYHPLFGNPDGPTNYDPSTGTWSNNKGEITKVFVSDNPAETTGRWANLVQQQGEGKGPLVPAYGSQFPDK